MRGFAALALAGALPLISGCVAAAIPLAAGAALARSQQKAARSVEGPIPGTQPAASADRDTVRIVPTTLTALPPPRPSGVAGRGGTEIARFAAYARTAGNAAAGTRTSAMLVSASALRPVRAPCAGRPAAVFLDLDPGRASFDPLGAGSAAPGLAATLASLRGNGIAVVWFTRLGDNFAVATRTVLRDTGLDPAGTDELVMMRDIAERKQSRRDEVAARLCPIAMLGDERADFDELYLYLRDPSAAIALDALLGRGWFLASPFAPDSSEPSEGT